MSMPPREPPSSIIRAAFVNRAAFGLLFGLTYGLFIALDMIIECGVHAHLERGVYPMPRATATVFEGIDRTHERGCGSGWPFACVVTT